MNTNPTVLLEKMLVALNDLQGLKENETESIITAINIVTTNISDLNSYILANPFETEADEINLFKKIKPGMDGRLIFLFMLLRLTQCGANIIESPFLLKQLNRIDQFYQTEKPFYLYYKLDRKDFDEKYFLRKSNANDFPYDEEHVHFDFNANTYMSAKAARIIAYDLFKKHIENTLLSSRSRTSSKKGAENEPVLKWTASVADFVEFVYSSHEYGLFGKGIKISTLTNFLSVQFGIKVTNVYKTWEDIRLRKKDKTPFLRSLISSLEKRIDHDNEFAP